MKYTRKHHWKVWTVGERKWGERVGLLARGIKAQRAVKRLEGAEETQECVLAELYQMIPEARTKRNPIKLAVMKLEQLKLWEPRVNPKWAGELVELHRCEKLHARMGNRGKWKPDEGRLLFGEARVTYDGRNMSIYDMTAEKIKKRLAVHCGMLGVRSTWW